MIDGRRLDDIAQKLINILPAGLQTAKDDLEKNLKLWLQSTLSQLNFVSRDEFDAQTKVLARTREKLDRLEHELAIIEQKIADQN
jgi:ubiquinone biosynthesis accessory factor UbiK